MPNNWLAIVKSEIDRQGWTIRELADRAGVNHSSIVDWLNGKRGIKADTLESICNALSIELRRKS